jgi:phage recombination protein Bet
MTKQNLPVAQSNNEEVSKYLTAMGLATKLSEHEKNQFVEICKAYQLNPFKREIYATKYGENFSIIVGYETYLKRAERTGKLNGWSVRTEGKVSDNSLKAVITIYRNDWQQPFIHEVYYTEYVQKTKEGRITKFWSEKPVTMTKKVVISQGFRMCFSDELGGMPFTAEEVIDNEQTFTAYEEISEAKGDLTLPIAAINDCNTLDELKVIWTANKKHQKNVDFINAKEARKLQIETLNEEDK